MKAYVAVVREDGHWVGAADSDTRGYVPIDGPYPLQSDAQLAADLMNEEIGITRKEAFAVKLCSMFRPGEYGDVLATM